MTQFLKPFDEKLKRYKQLIQNIRRTLRKGLNERNSYNFYIYVDELVPLVEYLKRKYNMKFHEDVYDIIEAYG